jgi:hypothetical protein
LGGQFFGRRQTLLCTLHTYFVLHPLVNLMLREFLPTLLRDSRVV